VVGTFLSPDTLIPDPTIVWDYNRMMYVRGNPLKYNDPSGHVCVPVVNVGNTCAEPVNWDAVQSSLDAVGVVEPTPFADASNAVISVVRGNYTDAGLSVLGMVPYLGDLAKGGKYADEAWQTGKGVWRWGKKALGFSDEVAEVRRFASRPFANNSTLNKNVIEQMYRGAWKNGQWEQADSIPGGLAGAIRRQLATGELVGGVDHLPKGLERLSQLKNILKTGKIDRQLLDDHDLGIVRGLHDDLQNSLQGK
jgi:hypothetical protein